MRSRTLRFWPISTKGPGRERPLLGTLTWTSSPTSILCSPFANPRPILIGIRNCARNRSRVQNYEHRPAADYVEHFYDFRLGWCNDSFAHLLAVARSEVRRRPLGESGSVAFPWLDIDVFPIGLRRYAEALRRPASAHCCRPGKLRQLGFVV